MLRYDKEGNPYTFLGNRPTGAIDAFGLEPVIPPGPYGPGTVACAAAEEQAEGYLQMAIAEPSDENVADSIAASLIAAKACTPPKPPPPSLLKKCLKGVGEFLLDVGESLIRFPIIILDPCLTNPHMPGCGGQIPASINCQCLICMKPVEEFMHEFFRARLIEEQSHQANRAPFRQRFFTQDCLYDSHVDTLKRMASEKIVGVEGGPSNPKIITEQTFHYKARARRIRLRYHLQPLADDWLIGSVQSACLVCEGRGDRNCPYCKGKLWRD